MDYDDYSKACDKIRAKNSEYLDLFEHALIEDGLKDSTIKRHLSNTDFYINDFLLYEEPLTIDYGISRIDSFLGDFFIRKCMWSTPGNIKSTAASIKKFYKCMMNHGIVKKAAMNSYALKSGMGWKPGRRTVLYIMILTNRIHLHFFF